MSFCELAGTTDAAARVPVRFRGAAAPMRPLDRADLPWHNTLSPRPIAMARTRTVTETSSLKLSVQTAEGDTVQLSIEAQSSRQSEKAWARTPEGRASERTQSRSKILNASISVTGDLNEQELADIQKLLGSLASGKPDDTPGESIGAYSYSWTQFRELSKSKVTLYA